MQNQKVLILELGGIGDVVMAIPVLEVLVENLKDDDLHILTVERTLPIVEQIQLRHPVKFKVKGVNILEKRGFISWLGFILRLRRERYDIVVDLSTIEGFLAGVRRYLFLKLLSAGEVIGRNTDGLGWAYTKGIDETLTSSEHEVERKFRVIGLLGIEAREKRPQLIIGSEDREWAQGFMGDLTGDSLIIGINPGAYRPSRIWGDARFIEVAQWVIDELSASVVITGGEKEKVIIERIAKELPQGRVRQCIGLPIPKLSAVIANLTLLITNDTGSMHVAAAVDTPIVALFGQTNLERYHPYIDKEKYIALKKDCTVCPHISFRDTMEECRRYSCNGQECMQLISVDEVKSAVKTLLKRLEESSYLQTP